MGKVMRHTLGASLNIRHNLSSSKGPKPLDRKSGSAGMPRPSSYAVFCLKKKITRVLPRHVEIIYAINQRFLNTVRLRFPNDEDKVRRLSLIDESGERYVRMAYLACVGSHAINGVAKLHTRLLEEEVLPDFFEMVPEKFSNKTNGVSQRRFLLLANSRLARLITDAIGSGWIKNLEDLRKLEPFALDAAFRERWRQVKHANKTDLAAHIERVTGLVVDPASLFDVHVKRIHEYKRQHLNILHVVTLYNRLKRDRVLDITPRSVIFGGKAAPGYFMAKLIIKLINSVGDTVDRDPDMQGRLKVVFIPDFNVQNAQRIYPAAELSEQISTAGKEASGTGNMKMSMNGALTIGTLDGANIEIREEVGAENFFLFGITTEEVADLSRRGYRPRAIYDSNEELREAIDSIASGAFSPQQPDLFRPLIESLLYNDPFMVLRDYQAYIDCQKMVDRSYADRERWTTMSILNAARIGKFSSDRAIREYCRDVWNIRVDQAPPA